LGNKRRDIRNSDKPLCAGFRNLVCQNVVHILATLGVNVEYSIPVFGFVWSKIGYYTSLFNELSYSSRPDVGGSLYSRISDWPQTFLNGSARPRVCPRYKFYNTNPIAFGPFFAAYNKGRISSVVWMEEIQRNAVVAATHAGAIAEIYDSHDSSVDAANNRAVY
jgi:hypothetical protein